MTFDDLMTKIEVAWTELEDEVIAACPSPAVPGFTPFRPRFPICFEEPRSELRGSYPQVDIRLSPKKMNVAVRGWSFCLGTATNMGTDKWDEIAPYLPAIQTLARLVSPASPSAHLLSFPLAYPSATPGYREVVLTETVEQAEDIFLPNLHKQIAELWPKRHELINSIHSAGNAMPDADYMNPYEPEYLA